MLRISSGVEANALKNLKSAARTSLWLALARRSPQAIDKILYIDSISKYYKMLPPELSARYQKFSNLLTQLQQIVASASLDRVALQQTLAKAQQLFQQQIMSLDIDDLDGSASRLQSYLTEINKQMKLLSTDVMFLQAARSEATLEQRQAQITSRLQTLIGYCQALLESK